MSLALAIRNNAKTITSAAAEYKKSVSLVSAFITGVLKSQIPAFKEPPPNLSDFSAAYSAACGDALGWANEVMPRLMGSPASVLSYDKIIGAIIGDAISNAAALVDNPSDSLAAEELRNDLKALNAQVGMVRVFASGALTASSEFSKKLPDMAAQLQNIAAAATKDAGADQGKIDQLNSDIDALHQHINSLSDTIGELRVAEKTEVSIGIASMSLDWIVAAFTWFVIGAVIAAEEGVIHLDTEAIKADQAKISANLASIKTLDADVAAFHALANSYSNMSGQVAQVEAALGRVIQQWSTLQGDISTAIDEINDALRDADAVRFAGVLSDLKAAAAEWETVVSIAGGLAMDVKVNTAKVAIGMSPDQVKTAMATGSTLSLIEFLNQPTV